MAFHQRDEIPRRVARERRAAEVGVRRFEVVGADVDVGEVAAATARDADLLGDLLGVALGPDGGHRDDAGVAVGRQILHDAQAECAGDAEADRLETLERLLRPHLLAVLFFCLLLLAILRRRPRLAACAARRGRCQAISRPMASSPRTMKYQVP